MSASICTPRRLAFPLAVLVFASPLQAQVGTVDTTYGNGGVASMPIASHPSSTSARGLAVGSAGSLYQLIDAFNDANERKRFVARYQPNGQPDLAFGSNGVIALQETEHREWSQIGVFPGGTAFLLNDYNDAVVVKFLASGFRDPTYGELGIARGQTLGSGWTMARRTDGQAVIAGAAQEEIGPSHTGFTPVLVRFLANGAIDTSFGSQGRVHAPFGPVCMRVATLVFDDAGGTIAAGPAESPGADAANRCRQTTLGVFRLLPNGQVDTSFGGGLVRVPLGENVKAGPLRIGDDGSVVAVATSEDSQGAAMHLVRISNQGQFGPNTMLRVPHPAYPAGFDDFAVDYSAALFDDGDIAIGGLLGQSPPVSAVVRLQGCRALSADGTGPVCAPSAPPDDDTDTGGGTPSPDPSDDPTVFRDEGGGSLGAPAIAMLLLFGVLRFSPGRRRSRPVPPRPSPR